MKLIIFLFVFAKITLATNSCIMLQGGGGVTCSSNFVFDTGSSLLNITGNIKTSSCYVTPKESDLGNSGSSLAIDLSTATTFTSTLNNSTPTITFSNPVAGCAYVVIFTQDSTGSRVPSFSGTSIIWGNSGTKTFSTAASAIDKFTCVYNGNISKLMCDLGLSYQ